MLRHHINGVQFYDWQYRWEDLLPDTDLFEDGLGRPQSMATIRRLIDLVRSANIAAMPYTAIYGVSAPFFHVHPDWGLFDAQGEVNRLGEDLIAIFDPTPGSPWNRHLLAEFADVLDNTMFDGIHIDQYGSPKNGYDASGNAVDLARVFPEFIQQAEALVDDKRGSAGAVIFNLVGNWPVETVAPVNPDATYIEIWPPHDDYADLFRIIAKAQSLSRKPVILAAYIPPENVINWRLSNAVIFASGAYHLETGEPGGMLQHPYFPQFGQIPEDERAAYGRYYDFLVRYENVLSLASPSDRDSAVTLEGVRTRGLRAIDRVMPVTRSGAGFETFSLINFKGIDFSTWNAPTTVPPQPFENLPLMIDASRPVKRVWAASPDNAATMEAVQLPFNVENGKLHLILPYLHYWTMIVVEYDDL
jgi:dextranase